MYKKNNNPHYVFYTLIISAVLFLIIIPAVILGKMYFRQSGNGTIKEDKVVIYNGSGKIINVLKSGGAVDKYSLGVGYGTKNSVSPILKNKKIPKNSELRYEYRIYERGHRKYLKIRVFKNTRLVELKNVDIFGNVVTSLNKNQYDKYTHP